MKRKAEPSDGLSDLAMWHRLSGLPDNVTDDGDIVHTSDAARQRVDKELLRTAIAALTRCDDGPAMVRSLAELAAKYFDGGDFEAAGRYAHAAQDMRLQSGQEL
jgi:hypothetical protein